MADDSGIATGGTSFSDNGQSSRSSNESATEQQRKLLIACKSGNLPVVEQLVEVRHVKLDPCFEDNLHHDTPLHVAAFHGRLSVVKYLIEKVLYDVECKNRFDNTPLHRAARQGQLDVVQYLIEDGKSDPMCKCNWNRTPLHHACRHGRFEVVNYLMENVQFDAFATENRYGCTALDLAAENGKLDVVRYMIEEKKCHEGQKDGFNTPLHQAAYGGRLEVVKYLITNNVFDSMCKGWRNRTPLHSACKKNQLEVVKYYMEECKIEFDSSCQDIHGLNPLDMAARHGALRVVNYMVKEKKCGVKHDTERQYSAIHHAAYGGKVDIVRYFVEGGHCDAECPGLKGRTPLHSACRNGMVDVVDYLVGEHNVNAMTPDERSGATPLHTAAKFGHKSVVKRLIIEYGCDHYVMDKNDKTPLDYANDDSIVKFLSNVEKIASDSLRATLQEGLKMDTKQPKPTGVTLGSGMYGSVVELLLDGERVAGKVFKGKRTVISEAQRRKLCDEISMVLRLKHSNIVSSKGVCFLPDIILPVLLMEQLMSTLHEYIIDPANSKLSMEAKVSLLHDIAKGLDYLHSHKPAIIHRDLTAKNVLLDSDLRAKISDFGNAQIVEITETMQYQPRPQVDTSIDILSFGHLALFTVLQKPVQLQPPTYDDSEGKQVHRSEEERREKYVVKAEQQLSKHQYILVMIKQCLDTPSNRPRTGDLLNRLDPCKCTPRPIRGADIVAEIAVKLTPGESLDFHWKGHGLKLYIPADALTLDTPAPEPITMTIRASINGQFLLPSDLELVSGIYWVSFSKHFSKPVTLSVQHCCNLEDPAQVSSLCFVATKSSQEELPYNFKRMTENSAFSTKSCCGTIELKHFCGVGIGQEKAAREKWNKRYIAQVYSHTHEEGRILIKNVHVPVIWDLELYRKVVKKCYSKEGTEDGPRVKLNIVSDELSLDIGQQPEGWVITPCVPLELFREDIDSYNEGTEIPTFQLEFSWEGDGTPKTLRHKIIIKGVKCTAAGSFINIIIHPDLRSPPPSPALSLPPVFLEASPSPSAAHLEPNEDVQPETEACLDIKDLFAVCEELQSVAANWEGIGSALGLPPNAIETIRSDCKDVDECLNAIIKVWLKKTYDTGEPSWKKLVQAVSHLCGGRDYALAQKIAKNHGVPSEDIRRSST